MRSVIISEYYLRAHEIRVQVSSPKSSTFFQWNICLHAVNHLSNPFWHIAGHTGQLHAKALTWGICFIILFCEVVGGQRSVSLSDAIQAAIMLTTFLLLPFVLVYHYGAWYDMVDYDCKGMTEAADGTIGGCLA